MDLPKNSILFHKVEELYEWYMSRVHTSMNLTNPLQCLSELMHVAQTSDLGGSYLSPQEEQQIYEALTHVQTDLCDGLLKLEQLKEKVEQILEKLTKTNTKARLVSRVTKLEYKFCIHSYESQTPEAKLLYTCLGHLLQNITPKLLEIQALAIDQVAAKLLQTQGSPLQIQQTLQAEMQHWIPFIHEDKRIDS